MYDLGNNWMLKEGAQKLEIEVFFRGIGGRQDTILTLAKLYEAGYYIHQYVMVDGDDIIGNGNLMCSGEATIAITTHFMPEQSDYIDNIYKVLTDTNPNPKINANHWLNDFDQYSKIQIRHRVDNGEFTDWVDGYDYKNVA